jgi:hypothetical protein
MYAVLYNDPNWLMKPSPIDLWCGWASCKMSCYGFGVTLFEGFDGEPNPAAFFAFTVKVYDVPLVRPFTVMGLEAPFLLIPPGLEITE